MARKAAARKATATNSAPATPAEVVPIAPPRELAAVPQAREVVDHKAARTALGALGKQLRGTSAAAERRDNVAKRREAKCRALIAALTTGKLPPRTNGKARTFNHREALMGTVQAAKNGATAEDFEGCTAARKLDWKHTAEIVARYASAMKVDADLVVGALGATYLEEKSK